MSNPDLTTISYDDIYLDINHYDDIKKDNMNQSLIEENKDTCIDKVCLWWFFHSSAGLMKEKKDNYKQCVCFDCCTWCCEFKCNKKGCCNCCGLDECGCCCLTFQFIE